MRFLYKISLRNRVILLISIAALAVVVSGIIPVYSMKTEMMDDRKHEVQNVVETAFGIITYYHERQRAGAMTQEAAQAQAMEQIKSLRYGHEDYFWINDFTPTMVMHPFKPEMNGTSLANFADPTGNKLFVAMVDIVRQQGAGFVHYMWPKPGAAKPVPKVTFVKGFTPWQWIIGSGIYVDDVDASFFSNLIFLLEDLLVVAIILLSTSTMIARSILKQLGAEIVPLLDSVTSLAAGNMTVRVHTAKGRSEEGIGRAINDLADSLNEVMQVIALHSGSISACAGELVKIRNLVVSDANTSSQIGQEVSQHNELLTREIISITEKIGLISGNIQAVSGAAYQVSGNVSTIASGAEEASANISTMAAAAEQITANLAGVNQSLSLVDQSVQDVAASIHDMSKALGGVSDLCEGASLESGKAKELAEQTQSIMERLSQSAKEIGQVVEVINNIAEQTNMLALNASIEAAGAGESGKGFAVVANEVKELARQTAQATHMISDKIHGIQANTREAAFANSEIGKAISRINQSNVEITLSVEQQNRTVHTISDAINTVAQSAASVTQNASELNFAAQEVARSAQEAALGTAEVARTASEVASGAESVARESSAAEEMSKAIRSSAEATEAASKTVQEKMQEATKISHQALGSAMQFQRMGAVLQDMTGALFASHMEMNTGAPLFPMRQIKGDFLVTQALLEQIIQGRTPPDLKALTETSETPLGQWLKTPQAQDFQPKHLVEEVKNLLNKLHEHARQAITIMAEQGWEGRDAADQKLQQFLASRKEIFTLLNKIYLANFASNDNRRTFFPWSHELETSVRFVDDDHRKLVDMVNDLHQAMKDEEGSTKVGAIIDGFVTYAETHFTREIAMLRDHGYPDLKNHGEKHVLLVNKLKELSNRYTHGEFTVVMDLLALAKDWLVGHIMHTDMLYVDHVKQRGQT
ncbi:MAG: bacteriohemerythrin [Magnetococcales bacterium]|nr:bacteriohemerythrin [Magnetococcales bacterium]